MIMCSVTRIDKIIIEYVIGSLKVDPVDDKLKGDDKHESR